jgi:hypothetical protein
MRVKISPSLLVTLMSVDTIHTCLQQSRHEEPHQPNGGIKQRNAYIYLSTTLYHYVTPKKPRANTELVGLALRSNARLGISIKMFY